MRKDQDKDERINNMIWGVIGEFGEVVDMLKKHKYQEHELNKTELLNEIGDVMFYIVNLATELDLDMGLALQMNIVKLLDRYPDGFDPERSVNRK